MNGYKDMQKNRPPIKIAIAVQKYHHPGQTFVNRHIQNLFNGNCVIIAERAYKIPPTHSPAQFYVGKAALNFKDILSLPFAMTNNYFNHHCFRIPFGNNRKKLIAYIKAHKIDAILSEFGSQSMLVTDVGREMRIPVFCYFRGRDASFWLNNPTRVKAYEKVFAQLSGVFAVSQFLLDNLAKKGLKHPNSFVVPSGTDTELFKPSQKDPNLVLAVGRFVPKKAPLATINAFLQASINHPNMRLEMIGNGPEYSKCAERVRECNAENKIILHGQKDSNFVASKTSEAAIFMQHSVTDHTGEAEGLPSSIQEAMSAGCAILSTDHAGTAELVTSGETGYLCAENDQEEYTKLLKKMLSNQEKTQKMGKKARKVALQKVDYKNLYKIVEREIQKSLDLSKAVS